MRNGLMFSDRRGEWDSGTPVFIRHRADEADGDFIGHLFQERTSVQPNSADIVELLQRRVATLSVVMAASCEFFAATSWSARGNGSPRTARPRRRLRRADIAARRQRVAVLADFLERGHVAEARLPRLACPSSSELAVDGGDPLDLLVGELLLLARAGDQRAELAPVDEQDLALPLAEAVPAAAVLRQEPEAQGSAYWRRAGR